MKYYAFYTQEVNGLSERFYLDDGQENTIVIPANTQEEAAEKLRCLYDGEEPVEEYLPAEELTGEPYEWHIGTTYVIWDIGTNGEYIYGKPQKIYME